MVKVAWFNLWHKPFSAIVSIMLMVLGVGMVSLVLHLGNQIEGQFTRNLGGVDMVVGAKGSPKQLILSAMYHIDAPTGNIPRLEAERIMKHPMLEAAVPLAYGDSYKGFKILGTTPGYFSLFDAELAQGVLNDKNMEVVLGHRAAHALGLGLGGHFHGTHGTEEADEEHVHHGHAYEVVGILKPTGLAIDQLIICNIGTVWEIHGGADEGADQEYTAVLAKWKGPMAMLTLPRLINTQTSMQAALPSIEISSLIDQLGIGIRTLESLAWLIIVVSGLSVWLSLLGALRERRYELAIMRSLGAHPVQLFALVMVEASMIAIMASVGGLVLSRLLLWYLSLYMAETYHYELAGFVLMAKEIWLVALSMAVALCAALTPAALAYRTNVTKILSE
ncbi:MAG: ABC transporter permease [Bacteroidetes bacterium]|nr:ABC transporter permease [Bacteroidota bacterium]